MKEFVTAVRTEVEEAEAPEGLHFMIDDHECIAYQPEGGQVALAMARMGRHTTLQEKMAGMIDFFVEVLDEESHTYVVRRLMDRRDPFGLNDVTQIISYLVEEWSGRPIQWPSDYMQSQKNGGPKSTARTRKSTSSRSQPTGS